MRSIPAVAFNFNIKIQKSKIRVGIMPSSRLKAGLEPSAETSPISNMSSSWHSRYTNWHHKYVACCLYVMCLCTVWRGVQSRYHWSKSASLRLGNAHLLAAVRYATGPHYIGFLGFPLSSSKHRLSWLIFFSSVPLGKFRGCTYMRLRPLPSRPSALHHSSVDLPSRAV
jgi:hypothetical protein